MTNQPEPIRKSSLPTTPPPEFEFFTFFPYPDDEGGDMVRGQRQRGVQVRRLVTYGDWEPVRPDRWADGPESAAVSAAVAPPTDQTALRDRIADTLATADGWVFAPGFKEGSPTYQGFLRQADAVLAVLPSAADRAADEVDADTVANRAAQVITTMGAEIRELTHSRDRYRTAWLSARHRVALRRMADETATETSAPRPAATEWTIDACYDLENDKWHGASNTYIDHDEAQAAFENLPRSDDGLSRLTPRLKVRLVRATTTYTVEAERTPAAGARQDETAADESAPGSTRARPCRTFVSGGAVWCCEEGEADCPCVCHHTAAGARQDGAESCAECGDPKTTHREGDDPVSPGYCTACPDDDAWHDYRPAHQDGTES